MGYRFLKKVKQLIQIIYTYKDPEDRRKAFEEAEPLTRHESHLWDVWIRWRHSGKTLWPWQWLTDGVVYEDHIAAIEQFENIIEEMQEKERIDSSTRSQIEHRRHELLRARKGFQ